MLILTDAYDVLTLVETSAVNCLTSDSWLGPAGTGGIGSARRGSLSAALALAAHEMPALIVEAVAASPDERDEVDDSDEIRVSFAVGVEHCGGDRDTARESVQTILGRLRRWAQEQNAGDDRLDGLLDDGDGLLAVTGSSTSEEAVDGSYRVRGKVGLEVRLRAVAAG